MIRTGFPLSLTSINRILPSRLYTTATRMHEYIFVLPDKPNILEKRLEVRPIHIKNAHDLYENQVLKMGGAILDKPHTEGITPGFQGSIMIIKAESQDKAWDIINSDIYTTSGVWDIDNAQVYPFLCALRAPADKK